MLGKWFCERQHSGTTTGSLATGSRFAEVTVFCFVTAVQLVWCACDLLLGRQAQLAGGLCLWPDPPLFCLSRPPRWRHEDATAQRPAGSRPGAGRLRRLVRSPGSAGVLPFYIVHCSHQRVQARWKEGDRRPQEAAEAKLLSQLSFPVYAGQVVLRAAAQRNYDRELGDREPFR